MSERDALLRRIDLAGRAALLVAGLLAQTAMWAVGRSWLYVVSAVLLIAVTAESARRPLTNATPKPGRRFRPRELVAVRVVAVVVVVEICLGVIGWLHIGDVRSMATPLGVLLVAVQAGHAVAIESRRDAKLGCAVIVAMLVHVGAFADTARVAVPVLAALVALLIAVALIQRATVLAQVTVVSAVGSLPLLRAWATAVSTAGAMACAAFLLLPNSLHLGSTAHISHAGAAGSLHGAASGRLLAGAATDSLDLRLRGTPTTAPVFAVPANAPAYWQGAVYDSFDGTRWTTTSADLVKPWALDNSGRGTSQTGPVDRLAPAGGTAASRTDTVDVLTAQPLDTVFAPGRATSYAGAGQVSSDGDGVTRLTGGPAKGDRYVVASTQVTASPAVLRAGAGPDATDPRWTALPPQLPTRIADLAAGLAASTATRYDAVVAVEDYLRTHATYDLNSPLPAPGADAVDDFLFISRRGFCEQFASAAVVMLRTRGIPARLVTGYSQGDTSRGTRVMRASDAHAWVQVWYQGTGWVDSDPTASAVPVAHPTANPEVTATPTPAPASHPATAHPAAATPAAPAAAAFPLLARSVHALPAGRFGWLAAIVLAVVVTLMITRLIPLLYRRLRKGADDDWKHGKVGPVLQAYLRLDDALAGVRRGRAPDETLREVSRRLGGQLATAAEVADALRCLERECYGIAALSASDVNTAVAVFDRLRRAVGSHEVAVPREPVDVH
ncbi:MAG: protein-glutamine gamma-glutamyltransferase [Actinomycetota bacterium]|jgi:transglutaminase-like putative cysteine protease|nr:protein-glutamine gamma-glutamyltransferase [Actinomycetota bacterium]